MLFSNRGRDSCQTSTCPHRCRMGSHPTQNGFCSIVQLFLSTKGLKESLCVFTGTIFAQCQNPVFSGLGCAMKWPDTADHEARTSRHFRFKLKRPNTRQGCERPVSKKQRDKTEKLWWVGMSMENLPGVQNIPKSNDGS